MTSATDRKRKERAGKRAAGLIEHTVWATLTSWPRIERYIARIHKSEAVRLLKQPAAKRNSGGKT